MNLRLPPHLRLGLAGENTAAAIYAANDYVVLERNWRCGRLELDLVCERDGEIVFVEVKTRRKAGFGGGAGAVNLGKQKRLLVAASFWLKQSGRWAAPCRFDVLCLYGDGAYFRMEHYPNAFGLSLDSSCSAWQS